MQTLVCVRIRREDIKPGDEITFDYARPDQHPPSRVGQVLDFVGSDADNNVCVRVWDYSLYDGPAFRSYRVDALRRLSRIEQGEVGVSPPARPLSLYQSALLTFRRKFYGGG